MCVREKLDSPVEEHQLLKVPPEDVPSTRPAILTPQGLSAERQQELFRHIRPYVRDPYKDVTCPAPQPAVT